MISQMFSPGAVSCLVDGRDPRPDEIDEMARKIWDDVYAHVRKIAWSEVDHGSAVYKSVQVAALVSLGVLAVVGFDVTTTLPVA